MGRAKKHTVSVVEAAYASAGSEAEWLDGIVRAAEPDLSEGLGALAYVYDASRAPIKVSTLAHRGVRVPLDVLVGAVAQADEEYVSRTFRTLSFGLGSEDVPFTELPAARGLVAVGIRDMVAINGYDPSGIGVWLGAPLPTERRRRPQEAATWTRVGTHLAAAFRLRRSSLRSIDDAAAVISPSGRVDHAKAEAREASARRALHEAVVRMERARGPMRHRDPDGALGLWRTLANGRYTLVDHFERGGRRYLVAFENPPQAKGPKTLTARERQVVALAAAGRSNKLIAYELGASDSTIRVLLMRAMRRLDVKTRPELIALWKAHGRASGASGS